MAPSKTASLDPKTLALMQHLERRGDSFRVAVAVPRKLQKLFGTSVIRQPLGVMSLADASRLKVPHVAKIKEWFTQALLTGQLPADFNGGSLTFEEVVTLTRQQLDELIAQGRDEEASELAEITFESVGETYGREMADKLRFVMARQGETPLALVVDAWLAAGDLKPSTKSERRTETQRFLEWASKTKGLPASHLTFDMVDRRLANRYMTEGMEGVHPATKKKRAGALRSFWAWAADNDHFNASIPLEQRVNPWKVSKSKIGAAPKPKKRPFTDAEVRLILDKANEEPRYGDLLKTLALTGARLSEIVTLRVADVNLEQSFFHIPEGKTEAACRDVPIHSDLLLVFRARVAGRSGDERVFAEIPLPKNPAQGAGHVVSKFVGRLRDRLKIAEGEAEGRRQAAVDTHSFRRWFIRKAVDVLKAHQGAGFNERTIAQVVGHDTEDDPLGLTMVRYAGKDDLATLRACVEAVRLPDPT